MTESIKLPFEGLNFEWRVLEDGSCVVRADEVCITLGWQAKDVSRIVQTKVFADYRFQDSFGKVGKPPWYLHEPGVWQLIFASNSAIAEKFQRWIFEDVLKKLRARAGYIMPSATSEQLEALEAEIIELKAENALAEQRGFNNAANKIFDPRAITEPEKHLLRMVKCLVNAIQRDFEYEISSKPINVRKQGMHRILLSNSKETYDGLPLGALSINTIFELLTILNHTDAGDGKNLVRAFYTLEVHWHAKVHPTRVIEGEFDEAILETAKKMQRVELLYLDAIRQRKAPPRLKSEVC